MRRPVRYLATTGLLAAALAAIALPATALAAPKSVLVISQSEPSWPSFQIEMAALRKALEAVPEGVTYHVEHLAGPRYERPGTQDRQREWIRTKYQGVHVDLILAAGSEAVRFLREDPEAWPGVPVVFLEVVSGMEVISPTPGTTGLYLPFDPVGTVRLALRLVPGTRKVALIAGTTPRERAGCAMMGKQIRGVEGIEVVDLCGRSMEELSRRVATLPPDAVILFLLLVQDAAGASFVPAEAAEDLAVLANRPMFSLQSTHVGRGIVGGVLTDYALAGEEAGKLALRILSGESPGAIPASTSEVTRARVDARALKRWGIPRDRVPAGTDVLFDEPTLWQRYREWILGGIAALFAQGIVIVGLLVERRRKREVAAATARAKELEEQVAHLNRVSSLGAMAGAIAHELGQPLTAIRNNAHSTVKLLSREPAALGDVRESIADIEHDAQRAGDVLQRMRAYLRREAAESLPVSLADVADEAARIVRPAAGRRGVEVRVENAPDLPPVMGDRVRILQVALNLATNAVEAAASAGPRGVVVLRTRRVGDEVELAVADTGPGIPSDVAARMFEPFFTRTPGGLGMGLAICRTIVEAHGGRIGILSAEPGRTEMGFALPEAGQATAP
ncbi:MAG: sensor histidine kinase [Anaeromyxobacteraceae bacterium]